MSKSIKWILAIVGILTVLVLIALSFNAPLWVDPSVILVEMERIAEGYVPYKTMHLNYPPLFFYMMAGLKKLFGVSYGCYSFYLAVIYCFSVGNALLIYHISRRFGAPKWLSCLASWIYLLYSFWMYGDCVIFEIPSIFFGLLSIYLSIDNNKRLWRYLGIGIFAAFSFLIKQFGAGYSLLVAYLILAFGDSDRWKRLGIYVIGYLIPIAVCLLIWKGDFIDSVLLNGYGGGSVRDLSADSTSMFQRYMYGLVYLCIRIPIIPASILFIPFAIKQNDWREVLLCYFGIGGFSLQFCFMTILSPALEPKQMHYALYLIPFVSVLIALLLSRNMGKAVKCMLYTCTILSLLYASYKVARFTVPRYISSKEESEEQNQMAERVKQYVPEGKTVWVVDGSLEFLYYKANLYPADMEKFAYSTGCFEVTPDKAKSEMIQVDYVLLFDGEGPSDWWRNYYDSEVQDFVTNHPRIDLGTINGEPVALYCMDPLE